MRREYSEGKTDIAWFNVIGNHEYSSAYNSDFSVIEGKDFSAIYRAINTNWSSLEDTWYFRDIKGYRFVFLNTGLSEPRPVAPGSRTTDRLAKGRAGIQ